MSEAAKRHTQHELDMSRIILKLRMLSNAVWGLTTPFQRRLCRHQARMVIQDKEEVQFHILKLQAVQRNSDRYLDYFSSSSEDCLNPKYIELVRN